MRPRYSSNSGVFERRGDPWVSEKEGRAQYGRNLFSEDPDFDRYFAERHEARERREVRTPVETPVVGVKMTPGRKAACIIAAAKLRHKGLR